MIRELCITLKMRAVAPGHTLREARCLAVLALIQLVLLCTLFGYRRILPDEMSRPEYRAVPVRVCRVLFMGVRGIPRLMPGPRAGIPALLF